MQTTNPRKYGKPPYSVVLVHGGPGAAGEMKPVAKELSKEFGVLEPLQTKKSVNGQVEELKYQIKDNSKGSVILVGYSWGAWLVFILVSRYPELVKKLILVGAGPFEAQYVSEIMTTRLSRLDDKDKQEVGELMKKIQDGDKSDKTLQEFGAILSKADSYKPIGQNDVSVDIQIDIYQKVWPEADNLRKTGKLLEYGKSIRCPVIVIHGDYDPHPFEGVKKPLLEVLENCKFILLRNCGHKPWTEKEAKNKFYDTLKKEL